MTWAIPSSASHARPQPTSSRTGLEGLDRPDQRHAGRTERDRDDETTEADDPAHQQLDAVTQRPGEVEVERQGDDDAGDDQPDADELVLDVPPTARRSSSVVAWRPRGVAGGVSLDTAPRPALPRGPPDVAPPDW